LGEVTLKNQPEQEKGNGDIRDTKTGEFHTISGKRAPIREFPGEIRQDRQVKAETVTRWERAPPGKPQKEGVLPIRRICWAKYSMCGQGHFPLGSTPNITIGRGGRVAAPCFQSIRKQTECENQQTAAQDSQTTTKQESIAIDKETKRCLRRVERKCQESKLLTSLTTRKCRGAQEQKGGPGGNDHKKKFVKNSRKQKRKKGEDLKTRDLAKISTISSGQEKVQGDSRGKQIGGHEGQSGEEFF